MKVEIDGININYIDEGEGDAVLLLHGWGANIQTMLPIFNILKGKCRAIAIDLPGFGESDEPKMPWNSFDYANLVKKFLELLSINKVILFGHSHGGRISIILSAKYPDLVKKMVLIDSAGIKPRRSIKYYTKVYSYKFLKNVYCKFVPEKKKGSYAKWLNNRFGSNDYKSTSGVMRKTIVKVLNDNLDKYLCMVKCSTLIIWGDNDSDTPVYMARRINKGIKDSGLIVLKGAGHFSYIDDYGTFRAVVDSFLSDNYYKKT